MAEMKLTYFNGRGRAELTRLLFTQAKRSFTDCRVEGEEWTKLKPCKGFTLILTNIKSII